MSEDKNYNVEKQLGITKSVNIFMKEKTVHIFL